MYRYIGDTVTTADNNGEQFDLRLQDYGNPEVWELINLDEDRAKVEAIIDDSVVTATSGEVIVDARSTQAILATTVAGSVAVGVGAKVGVGVAGAGVGVENRIATDVKAAITETGGNSSVTADKVTVNADDISSIDAFAAAVSVSFAFGAAAGVSVAVGASVALNEIANAAAASIDGGATVVAQQGDVTVSASTPELPIGAGVAATTLAGLNADDLDSAASVEVDDNDSPMAADLTRDFNTKTAIYNAMLARGFNVNRGDAATTNPADSDVVISDLTVSIVEEGKVWTVVDVDGRSFVITLDGGSFVAERANINAVSIAASVAVGGGIAGVGVAGAGAVSANAVLSTVTAEINSATVTAQNGGDVIVDARAENVINSIVLAVSVAAGFGKVGVGVGIGAAQALNYIGRDLSGNSVAGAGMVFAEILSSQVTASSGDVTVNAQLAQEINAITVAGSVAVSGGIVGVSVSGAGTGAINVIDGTTRAAIEGEGTFAGVSGQSLTVKASDISRIDAVAGTAAIAAGFGAVGVAVSVGVATASNTILSATEAVIDGGLTYGVSGGAGGVSVLAQNEAEINAVVAGASVAVSAGLVGVSFSAAVATAVNEIAGVTRAAIAGARVQTSNNGNILVDAVSDAAINATVVAASAAQWWMPMVA